MHPEPGYVEWPARQSPSTIVSCSWVSRPDKWAVGNVLPDACIDIIWDGRRLFVTGPDTGPVPVALFPGLAFAGVRFRPGKAPIGLGVPASELLDLRVDLAELWGGPCAERLADQLVSAPTVEAAATLLDAAVAERVRTGGEPDPLADALVELLGQRPSPKGVVRLAGEVLSIGERRLHRRCCAAVGYGPKTLERVLRFQHALRLSRRAPSLALLAARAGYADQAHLTRETRRLAGTTPSDLFKTGRSASL